MADKITSEEKAVLEELSAKYGFVLDDEINDKDPRLILARKFIEYRRALKELAEKGIFRPID